MFIPASATASDPDLVSMATRQGCMTLPDDSKGRPSAISMESGHLPARAGRLPEKMAEDCLFRQQKRVTSTRYLGKVGATGEGEL